MNVKIQFGAWITIRNHGQREYIVNLVEDDFRLLLKESLLESGGDVDAALHRVKQFCVSEIGRR